MLEIPNRTSYTPKRYLKVKGEAPFALIGLRMQSFITVNSIYDIFETETIAQVKAGRVSRELRTIVIRWE